MAEGERKTQARLEGVAILLTGIIIFNMTGKEYLLPWKGSGKRMFKVGVNFSGEGRNIADWKWVEG